MSKSNSIHQDINDIDFLIVDVETTGLNSNNGDRVCEVGAVKLRGSAIIETFESLIDPRRPISFGAYSVNRISPQILVDAPTFQEIADKLWKMIDNTVLVAYNAPFDLGFLCSEFQLAGFPPVKNFVVDALSLARKLLPGIGKYPQENVARVLGIRLPKHRALDDAMVTTKIFTLFLSIMKAYNLNQVKDLTRSDIIQVLYSKRIDIVKQSIEDRRNLWIKYLSRSSELIRERIITPKEIAPTNSYGRNISMLRAYCHSTSEERHFNIDRILDLRIVDRVI